MNKDLVVEKAREVIRDFHAYGINAVLREAGSGWVYDEFLYDVAELEKALGGKAEWYEFHPMETIEWEAETNSALISEFGDASAKGFEEPKGGRD